jgi:polyhydroxyalkanoate synthesis regulator phasin
MIEQYRDKLRQLCLQECAKRGVGRQLKNEAQSMMEQIEQITLKEMEELREEIARLKEKIEEKV